MDYLIAICKKIGNSAKLSIINLENARIIYKANSIE